MPPAARADDHHRCLRTENGIPHLGGDILQPASETVLIGNQPAARAGDFCLCKGGSNDIILTGEPTVLIRGKPAARLGDATDGGHITSGLSTVLIGPSPQAEAFRGAAKYHMPFVEKRTRARVAGPPPTL